MRIFPLWWIEDGVCACPDSIACGNKSGKHPLTRNGVKDATDDPAQIASWRAQYPKANWGIATGSGLLVVDLDVKPGKDGRQSIKRYGVLPPTRTVRTGSGGLHLYFSTSVRLGNTQGDTGKGLGIGIDTRGEGGYVLAPGSGHLSGGAYSLALDVPVAPLPDVLLEALQTSSQPPSAPTDRGFFGAATEDVLESARQALGAHGPAIEGNGGDGHTFRAAAILIHDFALTDEEAWPLLVEWNEECQPPWNERDLRAKLRGGGKYGKAEYGCKRPFNVLEVVTREVAKFQTSNGDVMELVKVARKIAERVHDPAIRGMMEREFSSATGLKKKELALPMPRQASTLELAPGQIEVTTRLHEVADYSLHAIAPHIFQRNGVLCDIAHTDRKFIHDLETSAIRDLMSRHASYVRNDEGDAVSQIAPLDVAQVLASRRSHPGVRVLDSITTAPIFLADGSILFERGYNEQARVYLEPSVKLDRLNPNPSQLDAAIAVGLFRDLLCDFKFHADADFSSWLAGLLTPLVKAAIGNSPAPLFIFSASSPGAGKTLLARIIGLIVTGNDPEIRPYNPKDPGEWGKRLTAFVKAATPVNVFDNVNGAIGDEALDRLITSSTWSDRQLGASEAPPLPVVGVWYATGNNIEPVRDTVRRVLMTRIEVDTERPQERTGFKRPLLAEYALERRAELLTAALTILRAYHVAGRPDMNLPSWGSFTAWSALIRNALVWSGAVDPFLTQRRANTEMSEPDDDAHDFWIGVIDESGGNVADICQVANQRDAAAVLGARETITPLHLRRWVSRFIDKPRAGRRIRREKLKSGVRYWVEAI